MVNDAAQHHVFYVGMLGAYLSRRVTVEDSAQKENCRGHEWSIGKGKLHGDIFVGGGGGGVESVVVGRSDCFCLSGFDFYER